MVKKLSLFILAIALALYVATPASAKDEKMQNTVTKEAGPVKQAVCDPACGFMVQSRDEKEIVSIIKQHAKTHHNMKVSDKDIKAKITDASVK